MGIEQNINLKKGIKVFIVVKLKVLHRVNVVVHCY